MMTDKVAAAETQVVDYANPTPAQQVKDLLARAQLSQRQGAREIGVDERTMRYYCGGQRDVPRYIILALERVASMNNELHEPIAARGSARDEADIKKAAQHLAQCLKATRLYSDQAADGIAQAIDKLIEAHLLTYMMSHVAAGR